MQITDTTYREVLEREIVLTRVIAAEKKLVFEAFSTAAALGEWFGPAGFTTTTFEFDFKVGGRWRFEFKGPDGTIYDNRIEYVEISPYDRLAFHHGSDKDNDPGRFFVTITLDEQQDKKTVLSLRQLHPTKEQRAAGIGFGAVEFGMQTLDKLSAYVAKLPLPASPASGGGATSTSLGVNSGGGGL
jgi:uncharacterized protein YndB with AHSA1/START domain